MLVSIILSMFICHAAKLGTTPSQLIMQGGIGMQIDVENVQKNVPFNTFVDWIGNISYDTRENFQGSLALALISANGEIKELIYEAKNIRLSPGSGYGQTYNFCNVCVRTDISDTDIIRFITLKHGDEIWLPVTSSECKSTYCKVKNNEIVKSKITVNILGLNDIPYEGYCEGTYGEYRQYDPIYSSSYNLNIMWPANKDHHFVKVGPDLDRVQIDPNRILFQSVRKPEYTVTLMACSDEELIMEQRHFTVETPGSLSLQLKDSEDLFYLNNISISGRIDQNDITFMRDEMPMLEHIDLSEADIVGGYLPDRAFEEKKIKSIILPKNLRGLGTNALSGTKLSKIDIPEGVNYYGLNAFNYSEDLTLIVLHNPKVINISWCVLEGTNRSKGVLFVPKGTREAFAANEEWGKFGQIVEGDNSDSWISESDDTYSYSGVYPEVSITKVINPTEVMVIPETVELNGRTFNVTGIGDRVFNSYIIKEIHIPKSITSLGEYAIESSSSARLVKIEVDQDNPAFFSDEGVLYDRKNSTMLTYPPAKMEREYSVPEGVTKIGGWACYNNFICKITFPSTLKSIGSCAFCYSNLRTINDPIIISKAENPPLIGSSAFYSQTYINAKVYVPSKSLEAYKSDKNWSSFLTIYPLSEDGDNPDDLISESDDTYSYSGVYPEVSITKVINPTEVMVIPETVELNGRTLNVTGIGDRVFDSYIIKEIYIPKTITSLGKYAISSSNTTSLIKIEVDQDNPVLFSDEGVLYGRNKSTMLTYPQAKKEREYTVPEGVTNIGGWACYNNYVCKITFPSTLKSIGSCAFCYSNLRTINDPVIISKAENPPSIGESAFDSKTYINAKVYVPSKSLEAYKSDKNWSSFLTIYPLPEESGIEDVKSDEMRINISGNTLNLNTNAAVEIYGIDGKLFYKGYDNIIELPNGIYIIRSNGIIKKIKI